jgi:hypothetical protein
MLIQVRGSLGIILKICIQKIGKPRRNEKLLDLNKTI